MCRNNILTHIKKFTELLRLEFEGDCDLRHLVKNNFNICLQDLLGRNTNYSFYSRFFYETINDQIRVVVIFDNLYTPSIGEVRVEVILDKTVIAESIYENKFNDLITCTKENILSQLNEVISSYHYSTYIKPFDSDIEKYAKYIYNVAEHDEGCGVDYCNMKCRKNLILKK